MDKYNFERINDLIEQELTERALEELKYYKELEPNDHNIDLLLIKIYKYTKKHEELQKIIEANESKKEKFIIHEAQLDIEIGDVDKGKSKLKKIAKTTDSIIAINQLAALAEKEGDKETAIFYYEEGIKIMENNVYSYNGLARIAKSEERYDDAEMYYKKIIEIAKYYKEPQRQKRLEIGITGLVELEIKRENYQKAYDYLLSLKGKEDSNLRRQTIFYLKNKLNLLTEKEKNYHGLKYDERQFLKYDKNAAIEHIKTHQKNRNNPKRTLFFEEISIDEIYELAKNEIENKKPIKSTLADTYIIELEKDVGIINKKLTNKIYVITEVNTKNIITMYPVPTYYNSKNKEVNKNEYKGRQRTRLSQIEKFNQKYSKI